jgi:hypothetical protein
MITTVNNSAQLLKALKAAHSGDTILLAAGNYNNISISGLSFPSGVTIASADPTHEAVLSNLVVTNSSGLTFKQLDLTTTTGTAATVTGSSNITFTQDTFAGTSSTAGTAMWLKTSSGVTVTGSTFANFGTGINVLTDSNLTITNNTFHSISGGAVRGTSVTNSTIANNTFTDASTTVPTHTDVLYLWQDNTANNVTVSGNFYGPPLPSVLTTTTQLIEALQNAHAGDVIHLAAGTYDGAAISGMQFATAVTITSADPTHEAVLTNLTVSNSSGLTFQGVAFGTTTGTAATVTNSQAITFTGDAFSGSAAGSGAAMTVSGSSGVSVTGSDFGKFATGINTTTDSNLSVTNNTFHDITGADIYGSGVVNSIISGNTFANASATNTTHTDVLNLTGSNNVTVANNTFPAPPPTVVTTTPPVTLTNAQILVQDLQNAHAGDVIQLAAGTYDGAVLSNLHFATGVTITSADPAHEAVISNLTVSNSSGLIFSGVTLTTGTGTAVTVTGSQTIGFTGDTFSGAGAGTAMAVSGSSGVSVTGSDIGNFATGLNLQTDSNVTVTGNNFHGNPGGGVVGSGVTASVINGNTFPDASSTNTTHTDVINLSGITTASQVEINGNAFGSAHIVTVSSVQQLQTALANAHGGDVIELAAGTYSNVMVESLNFAIPVTIMSADPNNHAVLQDVNVGASGVTFADLTFGTASATGIAADVENSSNIVFSHDAFSGPNDTTSTGLILRNDAGVTVTNTDVDHFNTGMQLVTSSGLTISNNTFEDIGIGAVRGTGVTNSTISGNDFTTADPTIANHQDVLYLWQDNTANNVTISGNTYGSGSTAVTDSSTPAVSTSTTTTTTTTPIVTTSPPASTGTVTSGANVVTVNSAAGLMSALQTATAGEVIKLAAGSYGDLQFSGLHFSGAGVTITSADTTNQAVVNSVAVWGMSSGINLDHLTVQLPSTEQYGLQIDGASNVNVSNMTITGTGTAGAYNGEGVLIRNATGVSVTNSDISHVNVGIESVDANTVTVSNNSIHDVSQDGIDTWGTTNEVVSHNTLTNFTPGAGIHPDAIQFAADPSGVANSNILVEDNVITRGASTALFQGIFVENTNHIEITGNAMAGTMYNGISLSSTSTGLVTNNFVEGFTDEISWIITRNVSSNVTLTNNQATQTVNYADGGVANPNYVETGTTIIPQANVGDYTAMNAWLAQHSPSTASLSDSFFLH